MTKLSHSTSIVIDDLDMSESNGDNSAPEVILVNPTNIPVLTETSFGPNDDDKVVCNDTEHGNNSEDDDYDSDEAEKELALNIVEICLYF